MALSQGDHLGPYEILGLLGAGGMGEVYRARDPRLDRDVAIKVLPEDVASDRERLRRFEKEARAAGALNHPNILAVYDVGTHEGSPYLVTELLEGDTIRARLAGASLPTEKTVDFAVQIARGLAAAHDKGIVHRDLKPENLFVTKDGLVKILDFGLAKLRGPQGQPRGTGDDVETASRTTDSGAVIGTAGYMSPEQVRGQTVDHRSDFFSFGAVLYEMLSGQRAFQGDSGVELLNAILKEEPRDIRDAERGITPQLTRVLKRCLEKRPEERFQSAHDLAVALELASSGRAAATSTPQWPWTKYRLRWVAVAAALATAVLTVTVFRASWRSREAVLDAERGEPASSPTGSDAASVSRVAVAIFENHTGDPTLDPLGLLTADWITDGLSRLRSIDVALSPSSALGIGGAADAQALAAQSDPRRVGEQTGAGVVVSGAYSLRQGDLVFTARLTEPQSGRLLLALEPVSGASKDPADVVEAVGGKVIGAVAFHLDIDFDAGVQRPPPLEAYREYMRAMELWYLDWPAVIDHLESAVSLEPHFVHAHVCLTIAHSLRGDYEEAEQHLAILEALTDLPPSSS